MLMWKQLEVNPWIWRRWCLCIPDSGVCWDCTDSNVIWNLFKETLRGMVSEKLLINSMIEKVKSTSSKSLFLLLAKQVLDRENAVLWFPAYMRSKSWHRLNSFTVLHFYQLKLLEQSRWSKEEQTIDHLLWNPWKKISPPGLVFPVL